MFYFDMACPEININSIWHMVHTLYLKDCDFWKRGSVCLPAVAFDPFYLSGSNQLAAFCAALFIWLGILKLKQ